MCNGNLHSHHSLVRLQIINIYGIISRNSQLGDGNVFSEIGSDFNCFYTCALKSNPHFIIITKPLPSYRKCALKKNDLKSCFISKQNTLLLFQTGFKLSFIKKLNMTFAVGLEREV